VVVRQWQGKDYGPGGNTVFLTKAPVEKPWRGFDDDDDRRRIETCWMKEAQPQGELGDPPQNNERAGRVPVLFTLLLFALATADRRPWEREAREGEPIGWHRWRRQLVEQTRDQVIVCAHGHDGLLHLAEDSLLVGVQRTEVPHEIGTRRQVLARYGLPARGSLLCWNFSKNFFSPRRCQGILSTATEMSCRPRVSPGYAESRPRR
jgi:hypothetical protein